MADIFISYFQRSPEPAETLAAQLKKEGFEVWWDSNLKSGERFDEVIKKELEDAEAAIVVWTAQSINSHYVIVEAAMALAWEKLITVRTADVLPTHIPGPFQRLHTGLVTDLERLIIALGEKGLRPRSTVRRRMSREDVLTALGELDPSLPRAVDGFLRKCQSAGFRVVVNRSIMIKASIPGFGEVNFGTLLPGGRLQTNYISDTSQRLGDGTIAVKYLDGIAALLDGATVCRDGKPWTWRVEVFGELPKISSIIARENEWITLMSETRRAFVALQTPK